MNFEPWDQDRPQPSGLKPGTFGNGRERRIEQTTEKGVVASGAAGNGSSSASVLASETQRQKRTLASAERTFERRRVNEERFQKPHCSARTRRDKACVRRLCSLKDTRFTRKTKGKKTARGKKKERKKSTISVAALRTFFVTW